MKCLLNMLLDEEYQIQYDCFTVPYLEKAINLLLQRLYFFPQMFDDLVSNNNGSFNNNYIYSSPLPSNWHRAVGMFNDTRNY